MANTKIPVELSSTPGIVDNSNATAITIDSSERVLIGKSSSTDSAALEIDANNVGSSTYSARIENSNTATNIFNVLRFAQGESGTATGIIGTGGSLAGNTAFRNTFAMITQNATGLVLGTNDTERMRIDSSGNVGIGCTGISGDAPNSDGFFFQGIGNLKFRVASDNQACQQYYSPTGGTGSPVGSITVGASSTGFNTSSDYRLKENVDYNFTALDRVAQLKPARFNFIADADTTVDGFLAHEVQDIVPEAITGEKDGVDDEGNPEYQGIDQSKLVPLLTKAIQEQQAQIDELKAKLEDK